MRRLTIFIILQLAVFGIFAQATGIRNREVSFSIGGSELDMQKFPENNQLDFLNYLDSYPEYVDYITVKLGCRFDFSSNMSTDIQLVLMDDLIPDNFDISVYYHLNKVIGIGLGSMLNKSYVSDFEQHHKQYFPDYYLVDANQQQLEVYDLGFYITPLLKITGGKWFRSDLKLDMGLSSFLKNEAVFYHKRKLSNERVVHHYNSKLAFQPYINPKMEFRFQALKINSTAFGLILKSNLYFGERRMNYNLLTQRWTAENGEMEVVKTVKHTFCRYEAGIGFYANW